MLNEIECSLFRKERIVFHSGLNIVLGDDDAKNSIGKSSALMAIDFAYGGNSLLEDKSGAIRELGDHIYYFAFTFSGKKYFFSRSTETPEIIHTCDEKYVKEGEITGLQFRTKLKEFYGLTECENSFRFLVGAFGRIWGKDTLDPDHPFISVAQEPSGKAILRLIDLFDHSKSISAERRVIEIQKERKKIISISMKENIISDVNRTKYKENVGIIAANNDRIEQLKKGFSGALAAYETLFDENLTVILAKIMDSTSL